MRLYEYFSENLEREPQVIDHHLRVERLANGSLHFYLHPAYVDGKTINFIVTATGGLTPLGEAPADFVANLAEEPSTVETRK